MEVILQISIPGLSSLSEEAVHQAEKVKNEHPVLAMFDNRPYSGISANINK